MSKFNVFSLSLAALALAATATAADAGSWPPTAAKKSAAANPATTVEATTKKDAATATVNGFEYIGGEAGWDPAQHRLLWSDGRLVHSEECDHAIRTAAAVPSIDEMETIHRRYPGG